LDLDRLTAEMLHVVDETMQPEFVGLWLREAASTKVSEQRLSVKGKRLCPNF
jgi:hypothetical protein